MPPRAHAKGAPTPSITLTTRGYHIDSADILHITPPAGTQGLVSGNTVTAINNTLVANAPVVNANAYSGTFFLATGSFPFAITMNGWSAVDWTIPALNPLKGRVSKAGSFIGNAFNLGYSQIRGRINTGFTGQLNSQTTTTVAYQLLLPLYDDVVAANVPMELGFENMAGGADSLTLSNGQGYSVPKTTGVLNTGGLLAFSVAYPAVSLLTAGGSVTGFAVLQAPSGGDGLVLRTPVSFTVPAANNAPVVSVTAPTPSTAGVGQTVTLTAKAQDAQYVLLAGDVDFRYKLVTDTTFTVIGTAGSVTGPNAVGQDRTFTLSWVVPATAGDYVVVAVANDDLGAITTSAEYPIRVN